MRGPFGHEWLLGGHLEIVTSSRQFYTFEPTAITGNPLISWCPFYGGAE